MKKFSKELMQLILINVIQQDITGERPVPDRFIYILNVWNMLH